MRLGHLSTGRLKGICLHWIKKRILKKEIFSVFHAEDDFHLPLIFVFTDLINGGKINCHFLCFAFVKLLWKIKLDYKDKKQKATLFPGYVFGVLFFCPWQSTLNNDNHTTILFSSFSEKKKAIPVWLLEFLIPLVDNVK